MIEIRSLARRAIRSKGAGFDGASPLIRAIKYVRWYSNLSLRDAKNVVLGEILNDEQSDG